MQVKSINLKRFLSENLIAKVILKPFKYIYILTMLFVNSILNVILSLLCYRSLKICLSNCFTRGIWYLYKRRIKFPHPVGIVIGLKVEIGYDCIIYQNVTIGTKNTANYKTAQYPKIGNNVIVYPNSVIVGDITIGDNVIIGAGSIILNDVPSNKIAVGNPAKIK